MEKTSASSPNQVNPATIQHKTLIINCLNISLRVCEYALYLGLGMAVFRAYQAAPSPYSVGAGAAAAIGGGALLGNIDASCEHVLVAALEDIATQKKIPQRNPEISIGGKLLAGVLGVVVLSYCNRPFYPTVPLKFVQFFGTLLISDRFIDSYGWSKRSTRSMILRKRVTNYDLNFHPS